MDPSSSPRSSITASAEQAQIAHLQSQMQQMYAQMQQQQQQLLAAQQVSAHPARAPELPKIRQPSSFSGAMGFAVDDWISELLQQFSYYGSKFPDDGSKVRFAVAYLSGAAMHWWEHQPQVVTWAEFVLALHGRFRPVHAAMLARQKLGKLRQRPGQSVNQYIGVFQTTLTPITDMGDMDQVHHFVNGLLPPVASKVWEKHPKDLVAAIDAAVSVEAMGNFGHAALPAGLRYSPAGSSTSSDAMDLTNIEQQEVEEIAPAASRTLPAVLAMLTAMDARLNALASSSSSTWKPKGNYSRDRIPGLDKETIKKLQADGKCFRCKKPGHMKNECPEKPKNE
jgi:hypothetical protein